MNPIEGFAWANICGTFFVLRMVWNKEMLYRHCFQHCLSVAIRRVQVDKGSLKLNGVHQHPFYADGVYMLKGSASGLCRFSTRLQKNAIAYGIYGMEDFNSAANNSNLDRLITLQSSVISILTSEGSKTNPCWSLLPSPKKFKR